ncbi:mucin-2-like isoform X2 [Sebastes umbrosus]|uniref:mucin-2-like isoform X2 n=1 Tax=Sebastes umbrosus TaxID=72105 RepID=UPI00189F91CE|nr:mucin-2-like isoform X2 [Sebastes umbrosus]
MERIEPYMFVVDMALNLCATLIKMAMNAKANKERCQQVAQRVKALEEQVLTIKKGGSRQISATVENALGDLCRTLESAMELMAKFSKTNALKGFWKSSSNEEKFWRVDKSLTDNLQVLQLALVIEQGDTLHKVYETVTERRRPHTRPSAPMFQPSTTPPETMSSPTTPNPFQNNMPPETMYSPTTPYPFQNNMPTVTMSSPTTPNPFQNNMPPMPMSIPTTPIPVPYIMSPMPLLRPMAPMPFSTTIVSRPALATVPPIVISSTIAPRPVLRLMAPVQAPCTMASMPLTRSFAPMTFLPPNTSVVRTYVVNNNSFFP